jgi:uncharacterized protein YecE (DUF72 family)
LQFYIGCSGWSYDSWEGHFYPKGTESKGYLPYYSKVFDYVEIDSSFYRIPNVFMTKRWARITPDNFRFTAKIPKTVTHDKRLGSEIESDMAYFYKSFEPLKGKTLALLLQLPPSMTVKEGLKKIETFPFEEGYRYAVEVRHKSWFDQSVYDLFSKLNICLVWNQLDDIEAPSQLTTDFVYLRFIGDRSIIDEKDFGTIQKDRIREMQKWARIVKKLKGDTIKRAILASNNHYAGFGPGTADMFRRMIGLPPVQYEEKQQTTLSDL